MAVLRAENLRPIARLARGNRVASLAARRPHVRIALVVPLADLAEPGQAALAVNRAAARVPLAAAGVIAVPALALRVAVDPPAWEAGAWGVAVAGAVAADEIARAI